MKEERVQGPTFRLFPNQLTEMVFGSYFLIALAWFAPVVVFIFGTFVFFNDSPAKIGTFLYWYLGDSNSINNVVTMCLFWLLMLPVLFAFVGWKRRVKSQIDWMLDEKRIEVPEEDWETEKKQYLLRFRAMLFSDRRKFILLCVIWGLILLYDLFVTEMGGNYLITLVIWGYIAWLALWVLYSTGAFIRQYTDEIPIKIQIGHPDHSGGLKKLGDFFFSMVTPLLAAGVLLSFLSIGGFFLERIAWEGEYFASLQKAWEPTDSIFIFLANLLFVLPVTIAAFFAPLNGIHRRMVVIKAAAHDAYAAQMAKLQKKMYAALDEPDAANARTAREKLDALTAYHPDRLGYPVWPFPYITLFKLALPTIISLLSLAVSIYEIL